MLPHSGTDISSISDPERLCAGEGRGRGLGEGRRAARGVGGSRKREAAPKNSQTEEKTINQKRR